MPSQLVDLDRLVADLPRSAAAYAAADPFPHTVVDDVLTPEAFGAAVAEFPGTDDPFWRGYLHVNETKYSNTVPGLVGGDPAGRRGRAVRSASSCATSSELTGIDGLMADWSMDGGGLHQTLRGGHLNIHADFTTHHEHENWARRVNILLYLNEEWPAEWGGQLELWDAAMTACRDRVTPRGNRMLVFTTSVDSFHGHPDPLTCPPGEARRSLALYYFTEEEAAVRRSTNYRARPGDGAKGVAIWADRQALAAYDRAKRRLGLRDETVQRLLTRLQRLRRRG